MSRDNVFVVTSVKDQYLPDPIDGVAVKCKTIEALSSALAEMTGEEVSILLIDVLDQDNHPGNAQIDVGGMTYYANIHAYALHEPK